jgi:integrase
MNTCKAIESYLYSCQSRGLSPQTISWYATILKYFAALNPILPGLPGSCEAFINSCKAGDERRHGYFRTLRAFYNYAEKRLGMANAVATLKAPKRSKKLPRPVPLDYMVQLLSFPHPGRIKAAIAFLIDTGVRIGELVKIQPGDFIENPPGYLVKVSGKTGPRIIPVSSRAQNAMIKYLPFNITANRLSRLVASAFREANVPGTAHCLRHSFGTYWQGEDISLLQHIMGHSNINTTMIYRQVQYDQLVKAHEQYSPLKLVLSQIGDTGII